MRITKKSIFAIAMATTIVFSSTVQLNAQEVEEVIPSSNYEIVEQMGLGFNLGKTFSQTLSDNLDINKMKKRVDAAYMAGFNTIRIPVQWSTHMDESGNIAKDDVILELEEIVEYCIDKDLYVILGSMGDLGENSSSRWDLPDVATDAFKTEYRNMWTDIAEIFADCDYHLVFEAYNEVKNNNEDVSGYGYSYGSNYTARADSYYFAGRCGNLINMVDLNKTFSSIMADVAPDRYYMISSYNADPRSAYTDYTNMTWENSRDHYINGSWNNTWFTMKGVDTTKAIYNCHMYKYGSTFTNEIAVLKNTFAKRGIQVPIYVDESGTHTANIGTSGVKSDYVIPVSYMTQDMASGICLWDDTQSMSYLNKSNYTWYNEDLISAMVEAAGQSPRTMEEAQMGM